MDGWRPNRRRRSPGKRPRRPKRLTRAISSWRRGKRRVLLSRERGSEEVPHAKEECAITGGYGHGAGPGPSWGVAATAPWPGRCVNRANSLLVGCATSSEGALIV